MTTDMQQDSKKSEILIYQNTAGRIKLDVLLEQETVWLTQEQMAELFGKVRSTINEHIKNIFAEGELVESEVMKKFGISEFQQKTPNYYSLDVIISVGYPSQLHLPARYLAQGRKDPLPLSAILCCHQSLRQYQSPSSPGGGWYA